MGLMTPDEVAATMRGESETGRPFTELAVERGHVSAEHMARIAKPVLPPVQRAPIDTQPAPPEQRTPIFADTVLQPRPAAAAPVEPLLPPPVEPAPAPVFAAVAPAPPVEVAPVIEQVAPVIEPEPALPEPELPAPVPAPVAVLPEPVVVAPDVAAVAPEQVTAMAPEPALVEPVPVIAAPEPQPQPVAIAPEPVVEPAPEPQPVVEPVPQPVAVGQPAPVIAPEPVPVAEPPVATPIQTAQVTAFVFVRLSNGERIAAGSFASEYGAEQCAQELMAAIDTPGSWPRVNGSYVRPDAILSIDLEVTGSN